MKIKARQMFRAEHPVKNAYLTGAIKIYFNPHEMARGALARPAVSSRQAHAGMGLKSLSIINLHS